MDVVTGSCNNQLDNFGYSRGILQDVEMANMQRRRNVQPVRGYVNKLAVIIPKDYFGFHKEPGTVGILYTSIPNVF